MCLNRNLSLLLSTSALLRGAIHRETAQFLSIVRPDEFLPQTIAFDWVHLVPAGEDELM